MGAAELQQLEAEFEALRTELIERFGSPPEVSGSEARA